MLSSRTTSANSITTTASNNKPDLVKGVEERKKKSAVSERESALASERSRKEVAALREMVKFNARAFEAMAVTLDHVTNKLNGLEAPELSQHLSDLKSKLNAKDEEIE